MATDPGTALAAILSALGLDPAVAARTPVGTAKMADADSCRWVERFRREGGA